MRVGGNMLAMAAANAVGPLSAVVTAPVLARSLGVVGRGELAAAYAPYLLATAVAAFGIPEAVTYFVARARMSAGGAVRRGLVLVLLSGGAAVVALVAASGWFSDGDTDLQRLIVLGAGATLPSLWIGILRGTAAGMQQWPLVVRERVLTSTLRLIAILVLAGTGRLTPTTATLTMVLVPVAGALSYGPLRDRVHRAPAVDRSDDPGAAAIMSYGVRVWIGSISGVLLLRLDQALMAPLSTTGELGLYAVAATISELPLITTAAMRDVIFAADAARQSADRLATTARVCGLSALAIGGAVSLTLPLWITLIFGGGFRDAVPVAWLLTAAVVLGAPGSIVGAGLSARGRPGLRSVSLVVAWLVNLVLVVLLVPRHGAVGAAIATLIGNAGAGLMAITFLNRAFGLSPWPFYGVRSGDLQLMVSGLRRAVVGARSRVWPPARSAL